MDIYPRSIVGIQKDLESRLFLGSTPSLQRTCLTFTMLSMSSSGVTDVSWFVYSEYRLCLLYCNLRRRFRVHQRNFSGEELDVGLHMLRVQQWYLACESWIRGL